MIVQEDILSAEEVAKILQVHPRTVKRLANQHTLVGFQVAGKWRFRRGALEDYIREQEQKDQQGEQSND